MAQWTGVRRGFARERAWAVTPTGPTAARVRVPAEVSHAAAGAQEQQPVSVFDAPVFANMVYKD